MIPRSDILARLDVVVHSARQAFADGKILDVFHTVGDACEWAKLADCPEATELDGLVRDLGRVAAGFRDAEEAFDRLFPLEKGSGADAVDWNEGDDDVEDSPEPEPELDDFGDCA
jgi:hypothetical protein